MHNLCVFCLCATNLWMACVLIACIHSEPVLCRKFVSIFCAVYIQKHAQVYTYTTHFQCVQFTTTLRALCIYTAL